MGNKQPKEGDRVEQRRLRSFNPNSDKKVRSASANVQSSLSIQQSGNIQQSGQTQQLGAAQQSIYTQSFGNVIKQSSNQNRQSTNTPYFSQNANQMNHSQTVSQLKTYPTFAEPSKMIVSQSVSPMNRTDNNSIPITSNNQVQYVNMQGQTSSSFLKQNEIQKNVSIYNNQQLKASQSQNINPSNMLDKSINSGSNNLILNKYYNGENFKNKSNVVLNKYFDGELINQSVIHNVSQNLLNKTQPKIDQSFSTIKQQTSKQRIPLSERNLSRRHSDNSIASFQKQVDYTHNHSRKRMQKNYKIQNDILAASDFMADYRLCSNLFNGSIQTLVQPSIMSFNQDIIQPFQIPDQNGSRQVIDRYQQDLELQKYLQFLTDTENNAISHVDFIHLAKKKKEDEEIQLMQILREQSKIQKFQKTQERNFISQQQNYQQNYNESNKQFFQNYLGQNNGLSNQEFINITDEQFRNETKRENNTVQSNNHQMTSKSQTSLRIPLNQEYNQQLSDNYKSLTPTQSSNNKTPNNLHYFQQKLFDDQTKKYRQNVDYINPQEKQHNYNKTNEYNPQKTVETLGQEENDEHLIHQEDWKEKGSPNFDVNENKQTHKQLGFDKYQQNQNQIVEDENDDDYNDEKYIKGNFNNQRDDKLNQNNNPFLQNVINNKNFFSNVSSIVMNTSQSDINQFQIDEQSNQKQNDRVFQKNQNSGSRNNLQKVENISKQPDQFQIQKDQQINLQLKQNQQINNQQETNQQIKNQQIKNQQAQNLQQKNPQIKNQQIVNQQINRVEQVLPEFLNQNNKQKIIGLNQVKIDQIQQLNQIQEVQQKESNSFHQNSKVLQNQQGNNSMMKESQISVVSDEEKMIHFSNKQSQLQNNSSIQNKQQQKQTTHFLPNYQYNHLQPNQKGTITQVTTTTQQQNLNTSNQSGIKKYQFQPQNEYNVQEFENSYDNMQYMEEEENMRSLANRRAEEEQDEEIRKKEIEMRILDKRMEKQKQQFHNSFQQKQDPMKEIANKHYEQLKKQQNIKDHSNLSINQSLTKQQQDGFIKRYQNGASGQLSQKNIVNNKNQSINTQQLNNNSNITKNGINGSTTQLNGKQQTNSQQNSNDKYKSSYMNMNQYSNQHQKKRNMQFDSYKQTHFQREQLSPAKHTETFSNSNSNYFKDNESIQNFMFTNNQNEDQESRQKHLQEYFQQKQIVQQQFKEREKQNKIFQLQKIEEEKQKQFQNIQHEEDHEEGIHDLDMFDEAESHHQDDDRQFDSDERQSQNSDEYDENSEDSMEGYRNGNKPIQVNMNLNQFKKGKGNNYQNNENNKSDPISPTKYEPEAIPIQIDIKDFMRKKNSINNNNQNQTKDLVQDTQKNIQYANKNNINYTPQPEQSKKYGNTPMSGRGSLPFDRQNSESEGESMLNSITQRVNKLKGKIERDKIDLDSSTIEIQTKIGTKVMNTLNNSQIPQSEVNSSHMLPSSSHKILEQFSSANNLQNLNENQQTMSESNLSNSHPKSNSSYQNIYYQQQNQQYQHQPLQNQSQQNKANTLQLPITTSSGRSQNLNQNNFNMQDSKLSQKSQKLNQFKNDNSLQVQKQERQKYDNQYETETGDNEEENQYTGDKMKNLYQEQNSYAPSPSDTKIGHDAFVAKRLGKQNTIKSQYEQNEESTVNNQNSESQFSLNELIRNRQQSMNIHVSQQNNSNNNFEENFNNLGSQKMSHYSSVNNLGDIKQSVSSQISHQNKQIDIQQTPQSLKNFNASQKSNSSNSLLQYQNPFTFQQGNHENSGSDQYFSSQPAQFTQFSQPLIDENVKRRPSTNKPTPPQNISRLNSGNQSSRNRQQQQEFEFDMPESGYFEKSNDRQTLTLPGIQKTSSNYNIQSSNSFYAQNQKNSIQNQQQMGGSNSHRSSKAGIDFFNTPRQSQNQQQSLGGIFSNKSSVAGFESKQQSINNQNNYEQQSQSSKQQLDFLDYIGQSKKIHENNDDDHFNRVFDSSSQPRQSDLNNYFYQSQQQQSEQQQSNNGYDYYNDTNDYQTYNGENEQAEGVFDLDAFGEADQDEQNSYHSDNVEPTSIKIDLNNFKKK